MKIQLSYYGKIHTFETEEKGLSDGMDLSDTIDVFLDMLVCAGYHRESIDSWICEMAEEIQREGEQEGPFVRFDDTGSGGDPVL